MSSVSENVPLIIYIGTKGEICHFLPSSELRDLSHRPLVYNDNVSNDGNGNVSKIKQDGDVMNTDH